VRETIMSDKADRVEIRAIGITYAQQNKFFKDLEAKILEGYRIASNDRLADQSLVIAGAAPRAVLYFEGETKVEETVKVEPEVEEAVEVEPEVEEAVEVELSNADKLEGLTAKADLLAFAEELGVEVPAKHKQPAAIKKFLQSKV
jgi:hypothetical protein